MWISRIENTIKAYEFKMKSLKELSEFTLKHDWSPFTFKDNYRNTNNWSSCELMVLDIDNEEKITCTIEQAKVLFKEFSYLIVTTKNHQIKKNGKISDRFRVILPLAVPIQDKEVYLNTWYSLSNKYNFIDKQCKDFARFYYQSKDFVAENKGKLFSPITEDIIPKDLEKKKNNLRLVNTTKGRLSRATTEFIVDGAPAGERNISCFKAAKDFQEQGYNFEEAFKALCKSASLSDEFTEEEIRRTVQSAYSSDPKYDPRLIGQKKTLIASTVLSLEDDPELYKVSDPINGPDFWDTTEEKWRKGEVLGLIAAPGTGKSSASLKIVRDIIFNNPNSNDIHFFFSLEMPRRQVIKRWHKLVGKNSPHSAKLCVIDNKACAERQTWQHISRFVKDTCKAMGKGVGCVIIDHMMVVSDKIDTTQEPHFDVSTDINSGRGKIKTVKLKDMCFLMHEVALYLDCFLIVQNQGTKEGASHGDTPMGIHAAYGAADFAWFCDYIITVWQPLKRVATESYLRVTAWQYAKIREIGENDLAKVYTRYALAFDMTTGDYRPLNALEQDEMDKLVERANALRKSEDKKEVSKYEATQSRSNYQRILALAEIKKNEEHR